MGPRAAHDLAKRGSKWLRELGLEGELTEWEHRVLTANPGELDEDDLINASWLSEAVTVLAWALGRLPLPDFDEPCAPADAANSLGFLARKGSTVLHEPHLRPPAELQEYNEFLYQIHWRIRHFESGGRRYDFESLARKAWGEPILRHGLRLADRDLVLGGVPMEQAKEHERNSLASITQERHRASNWLAGYGSTSFHDVTTDT